MFPDKLFDRYVWQARIVPFLIVVLPASLLVVVWLPTESLGWKLVSGLVSLVLLSLFSQLGRDAGKKLEPWLFEQWGGRPSIRKMRYRDTDLNWITLEQIRSKAAMTAGITSPTQEEEASDPTSADDVYDAYICQMREATRGDAILLNENISYGMRRNLRGMRWAGVVFALIGLAGSVGTIIWLSNFKESFVPGVVGLINVSLFVWWLLRVNANWVRVAAEAYADRLFKAFLVPKDATKTQAAA